MKKYLIIIILLDYSLSFSQEIKIPLTRVMGNGVFSMSVKYCSVEKDVSSIKGIPKNMEIFSIWNLNFQPNEYIYQKLLKQEISITDYINTIKIYKLDTTHLSKSKVKQNVHVFSGIKNNSKIIIFDTNNNDDFSDDRVFKFSKKSKIEGFGNKESLETLLLSYECFNGTQIIKKDYLIKFSPYDSGYSFNDPKYTKLQIFVGQYQHKTGSFMIGDEKFKVSVKNQSVDENYESSEVVFAKNEEPFYNPEPTNKIGDTLIIDKNLIFVKSISYLGDTLIIKRIGDMESHFGFREGDFIKKNELITLNNTKINIPNNKYIVLDFWGTWCTPCIKNIPKLISFHEKYGNKIDLISIAKDNNIELVKKYIKKHKIVWMNVFENSELNLPNYLYKKLSVNCFPSIILLDAQGKIIFRGCGEDSLELLERKFGSLFKN